MGECCTQRKSSVDEGERDEVLDPETEALK